MRIIFLVNDPADIAPRQTTRMMLSEATALGETWAVGVRDLGYAPDGQPWANARRVPADTPTPEAFVAALAEARKEYMELATANALLIRTNPARDEAAAAHRFALDVARHARDLGVRVINDPDGLLRASSKRYLLDLPEIARPLTYIGQDVATVLASIQAIDGPAVIKPIQGTRGTDVFFVAPEDANLKQIAEVILRSGPAMVQAFVPEATDGDTRVVVLDGAILRLGGHAAAVHRKPGTGEWRSNIHQGGTAHEGIITPGIQRVVDTIGPQLVRDGLRLVGLDFIGDRIVEANVFSTGGLFDAERYFGQPFARHIVEQFIRDEPPMVDGRS